MTRDFYTGGMSSELRDQRFSGRQTVGAKED
jgi:hypothetical protein